MLGTRRLRNRRGALEGLPLYLIILIVVAAIVVAILVGWLSTLKHPAVGNVTYNVSGSGAQALSQAGATCNTASDTACFNPQPNGGCTFTINPLPPGNVAGITINVADKGGGSLSGASVQLSGQTISVSASPSDTGVTDSSGNVVFNGVTGTVPPNDGAGGFIVIDVTYSSGGIQTQGSAQIPVESPSSC
ncbi:MAG: hypothetical protein KGJ23_01290 [Euryarchaeota archaeon]|nr:hypothetical protein [Euryarchaeota archaeon]MDE1835232.1 hypothetical protein [Euryarchaeota archaeon]MDE1881035.1 hypothetical protein [Euryarchaeota archaeon]MDE2043528.1 hypothetical protein [Thermoplasmata archaeon]